MNGKNVLGASLLATVLLLIVIVPLSTQQGSGTYDPWLDYNEDGRIDANDLQPLGQAYGTLGDPAKNVTIVGHASKTIKLAEDYWLGPSDPWGSGLITVDGYAKVTVFVYLDTAANDYRLRAWESTDSWAWVVDHVQNFDRNLVRTYDVMSKQIDIRLDNGPEEAWLYVTIYLAA